MKLLVVKTSSMGDVLHALPAITDASREISDLTVDWMVEAPFQAIPALHPAVHRVIPVAVRRWRRNWRQSLSEIGEIRSQLRSENYDLVIDSQGLIKSAMLALLAGTRVAGFSRASAREGLVSLTYHRQASIPRELHAVERQRRLFAELLGYALTGEPDFGIAPTEQPGGRIALIHGTTWETKCWPESYWQALCEQVSGAGLEVLIPAGNEAELERSRRIAGDTNARILDRLDLEVLIGELRACTGAVAVDTGLAHLMCALQTPLVSLYGATDPALTGTLGSAQQTLVSDHLPCIPCKNRSCRYPKPLESSKIYPPCYEPITPERVWQALQSRMNNLPRRGA